MKRKHTGTSGEQSLRKLQRTEAPPHINDLPDGVLEEIFSKLPCRDVWAVRSACRRWHCRVLETLEENFWRKRCALYGLCPEENTVIGTDFKHVRRLVEEEGDLKKRATIYLSYIMKWQDYMVACPPWRMQNGYGKVPWRIS